MKRVSYLGIFIATIVVIGIYVFKENSENTKNSDDLHISLHEMSYNRTKIKDSKVSKKKTKFDIYLERNKRLLKVCQRYKKEYKIQRNFEIMNIHTLKLGAGFLLDHKNKIGYCENPKVGTSTWMNYFFWLLPTEKQKMHGHAKHKENQDMRETIWEHFMVDHTQSFKKSSMRKVEKHLNHLRKRLNGKIFTFTFVRHPFERLVSAYKNKGLIRHKMKNLGHEKWFLRDHSFLSFVDLVLSEYRKSSCYKMYYSACNKDKYTFNYHWSPLTSRCSYCEVSYDVIGHMETFDDDVRYIFSKTKIDKFFPRKKYTKHLNPTKRNKKDETLFYFKQLTQSQYNDLYDMYRMDFEAFGYDQNLYKPQ